MKNSQTNVWKQYTILWYRVSSINSNPGDIVTIDQPDCKYVLEFSSRFFGMKQPEDGGLAYSYPLAHLMFTVKPVMVSTLN